MALAMFVGCDNAPTIPSFIVGGNISQTGDFLTGQTFDPTKFSVTVRYDNGRILPAEDVSVVLKETTTNGTVEAGDKVEVYLGKNYESQDITAEAGIRVYDINSITVEGPASYIDGTPIMNSDLKVTANYLDNTGAEKSMVLRSTEFTVGKIVVYANGFGPSAVNPSVEAYVSVVPEVGGVDSTTPEVGAVFTFTSTFQATELPEIAELVSVTINDDVVLPGWIYDEVPTPSFDNLTVNVKYVGKTYEAGESDILPADPGLEMRFIKSSDYSNLASNDLTGLENLNVRIGYGELAEITSSDNVKPSKVTLKVAPKAGFAGFVKDAELAAPVADDYIVTATYGTEFQIIPSDQVALTYSATEVTDADEEITAPEKVGENLYIVATYRGVRSSQDLSSLIGTKTPATVEAITAVTEGADLTQPKQLYYTATNLAALKPVAADVASITVKMSDGTTKTLTEDFTVDETGYYLSNAADAKKVDTTNIKPITVGEEEYYGIGDQLFIKVTHTESSKVGYLAVDTVEAAETDIKAITATPKYEHIYDADNNGVISDTEVQPMLDSGVEFTVVAYDAVTVGNVVNPDYQNWSIQMNGADVAKDDVVVTGSDQSYVIYTRIGGNELLQYSSTDDTKIVAGKGYVDVASKITAVASDSYKKLVGSQVSAGDFTLGGYTLKGDATALTYTVQEPTGKTVVSGSNTVKLSVTYLADTGFTVTEYPTVTFTGVANVNATKNGFKILNAAIENTSITEGDYAVGAAFTVDPTSYSSNGTVSLSVVSVTVTPSEGEAATYTLGQPFTVAVGDSVVFTISEYVSAADGNAVKDATSIAYAGAAAE